MILPYQPSSMPSAQGHASPESLQCILPAPVATPMSTLTPESTMLRPLRRALRPASPPMHESHLQGLTRIHQGKVRDIYEIPDDPRHMLIVTTDRLSAFDVVLPDPIPGKGRVLTSISNFWFARTGHIVPNHLAAPERRDLARVVPSAADRALLADRAMVVRKLKALPVEAVVRGYLIGSGWKDYQRTRRGLRHPAAGRACAWRTGCPSRSSRRRPRRPRASTTRTSASARSSS